MQNAVQLNKGYGLMYISWNRAGLQVLTLESHIKYSTSLLHMHTWSKLAWWWPRSLALATSVVVSHCRLPDIFHIVMIGTWKLHHFGCKYHPLCGVNILNPIGNIVDIVSKAQSLPSSSTLLPCRLYIYSCGRNDRKMNHQASQLKGGKKVSKCDKDNALYSI